MSREDWEPIIAIALATLLVLLLVGCKTLDQVAVDRERCHELGGEFESWSTGLDSDRYNTTCDLSDPKED